MAGEDQNSPDAVLRGLFGSFISGAEQNLSTADIWSSLRTAAQDWASSVLDVTTGGTATQEQINAAASNLIGHVSAADVSRYRGIAGQAVRANQNLQQLAEGQQIRAADIFVPPWNVTADNPAIPTRYRMRVLRSVSITGLPEFEKQQWSTYDLGITLTTVDDALSAADNAFNQQDYNRAWSINETLSYQIEAI